MTVGPKPCDRSVKHQRSDQLTAKMMGVWTADRPAPYTPFRHFPAEIRLFWAGPPHAAGVWCL